MSTDEQRAAHLAGEPSDLSPEERAELDEVVRLMADESLWVEPDPGLEDTVVAAVVARARADELGQARRARRRRGAWLLAAAAVGVVAGVATVVGLSATDPSAQTVTVALSGTELAPGADGSAELARFESGWRVRLDVSGLPRRDDGEFYEAWLRSADGTLVSVGTFNQPDDDLVLWSGVSPRDFPALSVTRESADGDPASSGERVLVGEVGATD